MPSNSRANYRPPYTLARAAEIYGVTEKTLRRWIASGRLTAYRFGPRQIRIRPQDIEALMEPIPFAKAEP